MRVGKKPEVDKSQVETREARVTRAGMAVELARAAQVFFLKHSLQASATVC